MARNVLAENQSVVKAQQTSIYVLGWFAQLLAVVGGSYATDSWPGRAIRWLFELVPIPHFIQVVIVVGFAGWALDIINDLTPNQVAITAGWLGPILAGSNDANGTIAERIREWSNALQDGVGGQISGLVGNLGAGTLAIICIFVAVIVGRRVLQKQSAGAGRGGGGPR